MFWKLLPKETIFFDFFEQHAKITLQAAQTLFQFTSVDKIDLQENINPIKILEHQADEITHHCIENLHKSFITPLQQDDIFRLITCMDDVIDCIDEAFEDCLTYNITTFTPAAREMVRLLVLATEKLEFNIKSLRDWKKHAGIIRETNHQIHLLENEADEQSRKALGQLFDVEQDIRLLIKWKDIYEALEKAMDYCDDVSNIIEGIILEYG
jgi:uncharacterized protein Yka (UPF0111/DUF47 family)